MLHLPSYELGKTLARFDRAGGTVKTDRAVLLDALIAIPDSIKGFETSGGMPLFPLSMMEGYETEIAKPTTAWWIHKHRVTQKYGGPEEGGWWFDSGVPTGEAPRGPFYVEDEAYELCRTLNGEENDRASRDEPYGYTSVLSYRSQHYSYSVSEARTAVSYPAETPHYE